MKRWRLMGGVLLALFGLLLLDVGAAVASRTFISKIPEFRETSSVALDAGGNVWVTDAGHETPEPNPGGNGLYEYNPFPSQTLLHTPDTHEPWGFSILDLQAAIDKQSGIIYVSQSNGRTVDLFTPEGKYIEEWSNIDGTGGVTGAGIHIAIDNTQTSSGGRVYLSLTAPENDVELFDTAERPVDFPATASYIENNKLKGTPSGRFGEVNNVTVDPDGNLYVTDTEEKVIDEFDPSGTFLRGFQVPGIQQGYPGTGGVGVDPTNGNVDITANSGVSEFDSSGNHLQTIAAQRAQGNSAVTAAGLLYVPVQEQVDIFTATSPVAGVAYDSVSSPTDTTVTLRGEVDPNGAGNITECTFEYGEEEGEYNLGELPCEGGSGLPYAAKTQVSAELNGLATGTTYHYRIVAVDANGRKYGADQTYSDQAVRDLHTEQATGVSESGATLTGSFIGSAEDTNYYFEWGPTAAYGNSTATPPGADAGSPSGPSRASLSTSLSGLAPYSTYHYRVVASHGVAGTSHGEDRWFTTLPGVPSSRHAAVTVVHSDRALFHGEVDPNGADTKVHFEYVDAEDFQQSGWAQAEKTSPEVAIGRSKHFRSITQLVNDLVPGTHYHYRVVGTNEAGTGTDEATFKTFEFIPSFNDPCPNAHVRQQTGAGLLLDCRAYELVSAANAGGYDVESNLVPGQNPFGGYPDAEGPPQVLYGTHNGGIPGTGVPTNHGVDPYVATRGDNGWTTRYVGIPADATPSTSPFASTLGEADAGLDIFAFGGPELCSPCFSDGSRGIPVHRPDGELVQGMTGSIPDPAAEPAGFVGKQLSADGAHLVFGSTTKLESDGSEGGISIYDRDLNSGTTHVVSKLPAGGNIPCLLHCPTDGIGELGISSDGSRIVVGQLVEEVGGAKYWHLYMNIGDSGETVDLTPGTTHGVLFDGMTDAGDRVFFTSVDPLSTAAAQDTDGSADIFDAEVGAGGTMTLTRVSTGTEGTGNSDSCEPAANTQHPHWNNAGTEENCGVTAIEGGGGAAREGGTIYFLSPEKLDGSSNGVQDAPNLYVAIPGSSPHFVATLESNANAPLPLPGHPFAKSFGAFENAAGVAIDHANGDIYVSDIGTSLGTSYVYKFDSSGNPVFSFGVGGKLSVSGAYGYYNLAAQLAVDNDPGSPNYRDLYVPQFLNRTIGKFSPSGAHLADLNTGGNFPAGVAVSPTNGQLYVADGFFGSSATVYDTSGAEVTEFETIPYPTSIAVDTAGNVYVADGGGYIGLEGTTEKYDSSGTDLGQVDGNPSYGVAVDPSDDHLYVDEGNRVAELDSSGNQAGQPSGSGLIAGSYAVAADAGRLVVSNPRQTNVAVFGTHVLPSDPNTDNPAVVDSVSSPGTRNTADFQVNSSGDDAVFTSTLPLTGYDNAAHREVYRYDTSTDSLECASCNQTEEQATAEATLASDGLSITDDGRVFFNSTEGLVDRDLNERMDAYEWEALGTETAQGVGKCTTEEGCVQLISTGTGPLDSSLLGASANGVDAYFFTHDTLVSSDNNGGRVKLYDARAGGGFEQAPPSHQCQASDECHGAGSQAPPPSPIRTISGSGGEKVPSKRCKAGFVRKHGKCVKKRHASRHKHRRRAGSHG